MDGPNFNAYHGGAMGTVSSMEIAVPGVECPATSTPLHSPEVWAAFYNGHTGKNRSDQYCQIEARNDLEAVAFWVRKAGSRSAATRDSYIKEANRFLAWAAITRGKRLSDITGTDLHHYQKFLGNPEPREIWVGRRGPRATGDGDWRPPFAGPLSEASIGTAMRTLLSLFEFLHEAAYLRGNPFVAVSIVQPTKEQDRVVRRNLSDEEWGAVKLAIQSLPRSSELEMRQYHRTRWLMFLLYLTGMRRSEVAVARMWNFRQTKDGRVLQVLGKGKKLRSIPVPIRLAQELALYRQSQGKSAWPESADASPLVERIIEVDERLQGDIVIKLSDHVHPTSIAKIVKGVFLRAADLVDDTYPDMANSLRGMSTHWIRHTYGSEMLEKGEDLKVVQDTLGHSDINTSMGYSHQKEKHRIQTTENVFAGIILSGEEI